MKRRIFRFTAWTMTVLLVFVLVSVFALAAPFSDSIRQSETVNDTTEYTTAADYTNDYITYQSRTLVSAHRAGSTLAPENTISAFKSCLENGGKYTVDVLEFDLHLTADGHLILLHDDTLDRTSNCTEIFNETEIKPITKTLSQLKLLNMAENFVDERGEYPYRGLRGGDIPADCKIATLEEVLDYTENARSDGSLSYIIEIKNSDAAGRASADLLYSILSERGLLNRAIIGTFNGDITDYLDEKYPDIIRSAGIIEVLRIFICYLLNRDLESVKYEVLQVPYVSYFPFLGSAKFIKYAHGYNIACQFWTINDGGDMRKLIANGADCIITDNPKLGYDVIESIF